MGLPFELTAENVVKYARNNNIRLRRCCTLGNYPNLCVRALLLHAAGQTRGMYSSQEDVIGIDRFDLNYIEAGFEDYTGYDTSDRYYQLGKEVFELSRKG